MEAPAAQPNHHEVFSKEKETMVSSFARLKCMLLFVAALQNSPFRLQQSM